MTFFQKKITRKTASNDRCKKYERKSQEVIKAGGQQHFHERFFFPYRSHQGKPVFLKGSFCESILQHIMVAEDITHSELGLKQRKLTAPIFMFPLQPFNCPKKGAKWQMFLHHIFCALTILNGDQTCFTFVCFQCLHLQWQLFRKICLIAFQNLFC